MRHRFLVAWVLVTFATNLGCSTWTAMPASDLTPTASEALIGKRVKFYTDDGPQELKVESVDYPFIIGSSYDAGDEASQKRRIDLRKVETIEIAKGPKWTTIALVVVLVGVVAALAIAWALDETGEGIEQGLRGNEQPVP